MNIELLICTNLLGVLSLSFLMFFTFGNVVFDKRKNVIFQLATVINIVMIITDALQYIFENLNMPGPSHYFIFVCYILNPLLPITLILLSYKDKKILVSLLVLFMVNLVICTICFICQGVKNFENVEVLINVSKISMIVTSVIALMALIYSVATKMKLIYRLDKILIVIISVAICASFLVEVIYSIRFLLWNTSAICLVIFYLFLHVKNLKNDALTGLANRFVFENDLRTLRKLDDTVIIVFDINNLKFINDTKGHYMGDKLIIKVAEEMEKRFDKGNCYRIGGDEFVFIGKKYNEELVNEKVQTFINNLNENVIVSYGYAFLDQSKEILDTFTEADNRMYAYKEEIKKTPRL